MKTTVRVVSVLALALAVGAGACGGGDGSGGGSCGVAPCGGDLVGSWSFTEVCLDQSALADAFGGTSCPTATVSAVNAAQSGPLEVTSTSYTITVTRTLSFTVNVPSSCISPATCADLEATFVASGDFQSATCTGTTTCACNLAIAPETSSETGTYTTSGNTLTTTSSAGETSSISYCVQGDTAHFLDIEGGETLSDEIAERQ